MDEVGFGVWQQQKKREITPSGLIPSTNAIFFIYRCQQIFEKIRKINSS
jgi:hypothetical protein